MRGMVVSRSINRTVVFVRVAGRQRMVGRLNAMTDQPIANFSPTISVSCRRALAFKPFPRAAQVVGDRCGPSHGSTSKR